MWGEFAVEPAAAASSLERFSGLIDRFGVGQGRMISDFAEVRWSRAVMEAADVAELGDIAKKCIEERLRELRDAKGVIRTGRVWPGVAGGWVANAAAEDARLPFYAIISEEGGSGSAGDCRAQDVRVDRAPCHVPGHAVVPRTASAIAWVAAPLLGLGRVVHLIDPYIAFSERWLRPLTALVNQCRPGAEVILHGRDGEQAAPRAAFGAEAQGKLAPRLRHDVTVRLRRWRVRIGGVPFHDRAVLTDMGGMTFGYGLAEGEPGSTVNVQRLDPDGYSAWLATVDPARSPYTLTDEIVLQQP